MSFRFQAHGFRTVLGRRMVLLFVLSALLPMTWVAFEGYSRINRQLADQAEQHSRAITGSAAMSVLDRLRLAENELDLVARLLRGSPDGAASLSLPRLRLLTDVALVEEAGEPTGLRGDPSLAVGDGKVRMSDGGWGLGTASQPGDTLSTARLVRRMDDGRHLWARLDPDSLVFSARLHADVPGASGICLVPPNGPAIACTAPVEPGFVSLLRRESLGSRAGHFTYDNPLGGSAWVGYWEVFLRGRYGVPSWTMATLRDRELMLAQGNEFRWMFNRILIVALALVLLVSGDQIRRNLRPLEELAGAAERAGAGDLSARVDIRSRDEFGAVGRTFNRMVSQLGRQFRSLDSLRRIDRAALAEPSRSTIVDAVLRHAADVVPADAVALWLPDESTGGVLYAARPGTGAGTRLEHVRFDAGAGGGDGGDAAATADGADGTIRVGTTPPWPADLDLLSGDGAQRYMTLRLGADGDAGLLTLASQDPAAFPAEVHQTALQLADQVALSLSTADLVHRLEEANTGALAALGRSVDLVSPWAAGHAERVASLSMAIGRAMDLGRRDIERLQRGALLHDIGKIGVPAGILQRPTALRPHEEERLREHVILGRRILEPIAAFADILPIVEQHHERWDGEGYPAGLAGEAIHPLARIIAVANAFDVLTSDGPDRARLEGPDALQRIREDAGHAFAPEPVAALGAVLRFGAARPVAAGAAAGPDRSTDSNSTPGLRA